MDNTKIISYIGFAIKMNKVIYGLESIKRSNKSIKVIVYDDTLGKDATKKINAINERTGITLVKVNFNLSEQYKKERLKLIGIIDDSLSRAIVKVAEYKMPSLQLAEVLNE